MYISSDYEYVENSVVLRSPKMSIYEYWLKCIACPNLILKISVIIPFIYFYFLSKNKITRNPREKDFFVLLSLFLSTITFQNGCTLVHK